MKIRSEIRAGECTGSWQYGIVQESSGGGYYGSVRDQGGATRYFNNGYTTFCPNREGVQVGETVMFQLYEPPNERAGKVACIGPRYDSIPT